MKKSSSIVKTDKQIVDAVMSDQRKGQDLMVGRYGQHGCEARGRRDGC